MRLSPLQTEGVFPKDAKAANGSYRARGEISRPFIHNALHAATLLSLAGLESCAESALPYFVASTLTFVSTAASSRQFRVESVPRNFARSSAIRIAAKKCRQAEK
jgi:hypothetical protein